MRWHTLAVPIMELGRLLTEIRRSGGTVTQSVPHDKTVLVTWATTEAALGQPDGA